MVQSVQWDGVDDVMLIHCPFSLCMHLSCRLGMRLVQEPDPFSIMSFCCIHEETLYRMA